MCLLTMVVTYLPVPVVAWTGMSSESEDSDSVMP